MAGHPTRRFLSRLWAAAACAGVALAGVACGSAEERALGRPEPALAPEARAPEEPSAVASPEPTAPETEPEVDRGPIAIDTHVDTTQRMLDASDDLADRLPDGHLDLPRMREGGLTGAFFSIWVRPSAYPGEAAWTRAQALIGAVQQLAERHPDEAAVCRTAEEVRAAHREGRAALLMGVEGAHALGDPEDDEVLLARIGRLHTQGVRYMTVTWSNDNRLGHSSGGDHPERGLTDLGRRAIREMNRLGMIVDVSHVSDRTFWDIVEIAERPLLASHSSCRALSDHPRNMTDDMIRAVAERGGAVCINYYTTFLDAEYGRRRRRVERAHRAELRTIRDAHEHSWQRWAETNAAIRGFDPTLEPPGIAQLGAHFAHVASIASPDAVCLGSDFDGVGELPAGLEDVADLGALREELERRELPVAPIFGENVLRVLAAQTPSD